MVAVLSVYFLPTRVPVPTPFERAHILFLHKTRNCPCVLICLSLVTGDGAGHLFLNFLDVCVSSLERHLTRGARGPCFAWIHGCIPSTEYTETFPQMFGGSKY